MTGNMDDDLLYDLFGDEGILTPESSSSTDIDSGHGSPFDSNFDGSPQSFDWETSDHVGELWGSILDDLPSEITDDSDSNEYKSPLSCSYDEKTEPLTWSTKVLDEGTCFDSNNYTMNVDNGWNFNENIVCSSMSNSINDSGCLPGTDTSNINIKSEDNADGITSSMLTMPSAPMSQIFSTPISINNNENEVNDQAQPIVVKPNNVGKGPTWVVKTSDIKSHFKIGQNIVAIIQSVSNNTNNSNGKMTLDLDALCENLKDENVSDDLMATNDTESTFSNTEHKDHDYADKEMPQLKETTGVSKGMGPGLILTDEEKKLLELESLKLPEDSPLTKEEEKVLKKVRRKIKNKQSAMESRRKRKEYIDNLERRVKHCTDMNHGLRKKVDKLTKENKSLANQLKTLKDFIATSFNQNRTATTGTCLAVLLLSFALFILPINPYYYEGKSSDTTLPTETPNPTPVFRSRTLLSVDVNTDYVYDDHEYNTSFSSVSYDNLLTEPNTYSDGVKFELGSVGNYLENEHVLRKTNISMYIRGNLTLHRDMQIDNYVNS